MRSTAEPPLHTATEASAQAAHSRFVQRIRRRYAGELALLPVGLPARAQMQGLIDALLAGGRALPSALRVARQLVIERLAVLDIEQQAPLDAVTQTMSLLAEVTLDRALAQALLEQDARHGAPLKQDGERSAFWVVGMGKLGARELNVSSDIDLVYVYDEDAPTAGRADGGGVVSAHEYFS